jgi:hypothetical protein
VVVAAAALAACSSSSSVATTTTTRGSVAAAKTGCALITPAEIQSTMGVAVDPPVATVRGSVTTCAYKAGDISDSVLIEYKTGATAASFAADRSTIDSHHLTTNSLSGLGDQAYAFSQTSGQTTINSVVTLQGALETIVTATTPLVRVEAMSAEIIDALTGSPTGSTSTTG